MTTPQVAQLIAEERMAAGSRAAENARRFRLLQGERPSIWARVTGRVGAPASRLERVLHLRRPAAPVPCTCA